MKSIEHYEQLAREAKAEGCRHENRDHLRAGEILIRADGTDLHEVKCEQFRCVDCGAWLSLGPSNDRGRRVRVEIAAARLIAGTESADDTDDTLNDPICREVIAHILGEANMRSQRSRDAHELHEVALYPSSHEAEQPPRRLTDAVIDKVFAKAPATIREVQESLRGVVTP